MSALIIPCRPTVVLSLPAVVLVGRVPCWRQWLTVIIFWDLLSGESTVLPHDYHGEIAFCAPSKSRATTEWEGNCVFPPFDVSACSLPETAPVYQRKCKREPNDIGPRAAPRMEPNFQECLLESVYNIFGISGCWLTPLVFSYIFHMVCVYVVTRFSLVILEVVLTLVRLRDYI